MGLLYGRAGRLTAENGGFRPGQVGRALARAGPLHTFGEVAAAASGLVRSVFANVLEAQQLREAQVPPSHLPPRAGRHDSRFSLVSSVRHAQAQEQGAAEARELEIQQENRAREVAMKFAALQRAFAPSTWSSRTPSGTPRTPKKSKVRDCRLVCTPPRGLPRFFSTSR